MEIHELNTKTLTSPAYVALDDGTDTYKLDLNAKLSTMQSSISGAESNISTLQDDFEEIDEELSELNNAIQSLSSIPTEVKQAMDTLFQNVAFKNDGDYSSEISAFHAWATTVTLLSISAVYTQSGNIYEYDSLESLKDDLVVTANYDDETTATVTGYTLSGTLTEGTSTITVSYGGKTATFTVTVSSTTKAVWDYTLGRLPSSADGIEKSTSGTYTETLESDGIHASCGTANTDYLRYAPTASSLQAGTNIISEHEFIISALGNTSANVAAILSNGTDGCNIIFVNTTDINYYKGNTRTKIGTLSLNTLYKLRIEYESGVQAKVYLNDELILTQANADKSTYYTTTSRLGVQNNASVIIKSMKWYAGGV